MSYCIDTSALMDAWVRWYPIDLFPSLWDEMDELIDKEEIYAPEEVLIEISKKDDDLHSWAKDRVSMFQPPQEEVQLRLQEIMSVFPKIIDVKRDRSGADPYVIAVAMTKNGTVVTGEKGQGSFKNPRIPDVCDYFKVKHLSFMEFIRERSWSF